MYLQQMNCIWGVFESHVLKGDLTQDLSDVPHVLQLIINVKFLANISEGIA